MLFACPKCSRQETVLLDPKPLCRFCSIEMIPESNYEGLWMSPFIVIRRMVTIRETYGVEVASTDGRLKREREAFTSGLLALGLAKLTGEQWWIEIETKDNTPDTKLKRLDQSTGNNVVQTRPVEVVDWEENVDDVMEVIRKKCRRAYPGDYLLAVHARHVGKELDLNRIVKETESIRSPFLEVWVIAFVGPDDVRVVRVSPGDLGTDLKLAAELEKASQQPPFMTPRMRGTGIELQDLGLLFLPIPKLD
jgi:hypothetical protein